MAPSRTLGTDYSVRVTEPARFSKAATAGE